jgi:hypothetical protein
VSNGLFSNQGLLTGSAFPQGGAITNSHIPYRKKPKALQNAHTLKGTMVCFVALQTAPLNVYPFTPRSSIFCAPCI